MSSKRRPALVVSLDGRTDAERYQYDTISQWRRRMANVLVRDLDDDVLRELKASAKAHGRSLQAEIHDVLKRAGTRNLAETRRLSGQWLKRLKRLSRSSHSDSTALIRDDRDAR